VLSTCRGPGSAARQATALRHEGVTVDQDAMGDFSIDLQRYGWFPDRLPSEEGEESDSESDSAGDGVEGSENGLFV
jgi:methylated-DNA-protein-cysteine methyltransferase related protein